MEVTITTPKVHDLKIHPHWFKEILFNRKKAELRFDDRNYQERELLNLREFDPITQTYTGMSITREINYIIRDVPGLLENFVILQLSKPLEDVT